MMEQKVIISQEPAPENEFAVFLCGSQSYGLALSVSDSDWRVVGSAPQAELCGARFAAYQAEPPALLAGEAGRLDCAYTNVGLLADSAMHSTLFNINPFFASEVRVFDVYWPFIKELLERKERISRMNLPHLRETLALDIFKAYNGSQRQTYGQRNKLLMRTVFYCDLYRRFAEGATFWDCIHPGEDDKALYRAVLTGTMPEADARQLATDRMARNDAPEVLDFWRQPPDVALYEELKELTVDFLAAQSGRG